MDKSTAYGRLDCEYFFACTKGTPRLYKRYIIEDDIYELDCWDREYAKGVNDVQEIIEKRLTEVENG